MNQRAKKIKSSVLENPDAGTLSYSCLTDILFQVSTTNKSPYELRYCQRALAGRTKNYHASAALRWIHFQIKKIIVESEQNAVVRPRSL
jgi:hypothetical protein